ncbi:MAG: FAD-binding oxidoreductase, partial [Deltaproteobacteria bacterium]|nr:FAD-binding oxidoreductase [Deltaproteobacteria bacterium]
MTHALASELETIVGAGGVSRDAADRVSYARDLWPRGLVRMRAGRAPATPPALVVWPRTVEQVAEIVTRARAHGAPVVPFGAGSGVCGGVLPTPATVVVDLKRMREVRVIDAAELECEAEAGVLGQHLEDRLLEAGLTLGHYPSSIMTSTLGGWVAARSAGQCSGRYGKIEDMVLALEMVDGEGRIHRVERDGPAGALVPLVIGSEGTMAIVTAARVRIAPAPETRRFAAFSVPTTAAGIHVLRRVYQAGLRPAVARLYDPVDTALAKRSRRKHAAAAVGTNAKKRQVRSTPSAEARLLARAGAVNTVLHALGDETLGGCLMIFVWETHGPLADAELDVTTRIAHEQGGRDLGDGPAQRWLVRRHAVSYRQSPAFADGLFADTMEVAAPWSRLLGVYHAVREALAPYVVVLAHFSHAYPHGGSIYFTYAGAAHDGDAAITRYETTWRTALAAAIDAGATLSHHHGVGRSKAPAMRREQGAAIELVRRLQLALDPGRILNPGALV